MQKGDRESVSWGAGSIKTTFILAASIRRPFSSIICKNRWLPIPQKLLTIWAFYGNLAFNRPHLDVTSWSDYFSMRTKTLNLSKKERHLGGMTEMWQVTWLTLYCLAHVMNNGIFQLTRFSTQFKNVTFPQTLITLACFLACVLFFH